MSAECSPCLTPDLQALPALKTIFHSQGGADARVGIVHNLMPFEPRQDGISNRLPHVHLASSVLGHMWNEPQMKFLQTGACACTERVLCVCW